MLDEAEYLSKMANKDKEVKELAQSIIRLINQKNISVSEYSSEYAEALTFYVDYSLQISNDSAIKILLEAKEISEKNYLSKTINYYRIIKNIGVRYSKMNNPPTAKHYLLQALKLSDELCVEKDESFIQMQKEYSTILIEDKDLVGAIKILNLVIKNGKIISPNESFEYIFRLLEINQTLSQVYANKDFYIKYFIQVEKFFIQLQNYIPSNIQLELLILENIITDLIGRGIDSTRSKYQKRMMELSNFSDNFGN